MVQLLGLHTSTGELRSHKLRGVAKTKQNSQMGRHAAAAVTASKVAPWPHLQVLKPPAPLRLDQGRSGSQQRRAEQQHF